MSFVRFQKPSEFTSLIPITHTDLTGNIPTPYIVNWFQQSGVEYLAWRWTLQYARVLLQDVKSSRLLGFHLQHSDDDDEKVDDDDDFDAGESFVFALTFRVMVMIKMMLMLMRSLFTFRAPAAADLEAALLFSRFSPDSSMLPPLQRHVCQKVSGNCQNE